MELMISKYVSKGERKQASKQVIKEVIKYISKTAFLLLNKITIVMRAVKE